MAYQQRAGEGRPIRSLCSVAARYQRRTKARLRPPCYLICACLFMCHVRRLPVGAEDVWHAGANGTGHRGYHVAFRGPTSDWLIVQHQTEMDSSNHPKCVTHFQRKTFLALCLQPYCWKCCFVGASTNDTWPGEVSIPFMTSERDNFDFQNYVLKHTDTHTHSVAKTKRRREWTCAHFFRVHSQTAGTRAEGSHITARKCILPTMWPLSFPLASNSPASCFEPKMINTHRVFFETLGWNPQCAAGIHDDNTPDI